MKQHESKTDKEQNSRQQTRHRTALFFFITFGRKIVHLCAKTFLAVILDYFVQCFMAVIRAMYFRDVRYHTLRSTLLHACLTQPVKVPHRRAHVVANMAGRRFDASVDPSALIAPETRV